MAAQTPGQGQFFIIFDRYRLTAITEKTGEIETSYEKDIFRNYKT